MYLQHITIKILIYFKPICIQSRVKLTKSFLKNYWLFYLEAEGPTNINIVIIHIIN